MGAAMQRQRQRQREQLLGLNIGNRGAGDRASAPPPLLLYGTPELQRLKASLGSATTDTSTAAAAANPLEDLCIKAPATLDHAQQQQQQQQQHLGRFRPLRSLPMWVGDVTASAPAPAPSVDQPAHSAPVPAPAPERALTPAVVSFVEAPAISGFALADSQPSSSEDDDEDEDEEEGKGEQEGKGELTNALSVATPAVTQPLPLWSWPVSHCRTARRLLRRRRGRGRGRGTES